MLKNLQNKNVYHGSYIEVRNPDLSKCKKGKDFGVGFYITTDRNQAIRFTKIVANRNGLSQGVLNIYKFSNFENLNVYEFESTNVEWLNCVIGNRNKQFKKLAYPFKDYDVLIGKIADDNTSTVINAYMSGVLGPVGSQIAINTAINQFLTNTLNNQICFKTEKSLERLKFFRSEKIWV